MQKMNSIRPKHSEEQLLVEIIDGGERFKMHPCAMSAWKRMKKAARAEEICLYIVSAFRSITRQSENRVGILPSDALTCCIHPVPMS